ncbi:MAG TPA: hypothetical protein VH257_06405 [Chloroflexota bacterium]|nr:hypothetical protein [Chloroflexota bacterium]
MRAREAPPGAAHEVVPAAAADEAGPFAGRPDTDPARLAYRVAHRHGFPFLRLRSGRTFGAGEGAWWRDVGRAEGERDQEALYRVVRHLELGDEDGPGRAPAAGEAGTG